MSKPRETSYKGHKSADLQASAATPGPGLKTGTVYKTVNQIAQYARLHPDPCNPFRRNSRKQLP